MIKLIAFDLDGTLTQHKTPIDEKNKSILDRLSKKYRLVMVGAGQCRRIFNQLGEYPIDIVGNYGLQYARYDEKKQNIVIERDRIFSCDKESVKHRVAMLREKYGFTEFAGDSVEFHPSGCVTFAILGTKAKAEDKMII